MWSFPGLIMTPAYDDNAGRERQIMFETMASKLPVRRVGRAEDVTSTVLYLMQNGYTTGTVIHVDGGHRLI